MNALIIKSAKLREFGIKNTKKSYRNSQSDVVLVYVDINNTKKCLARNFL